MSFAQSDWQESVQAMADDATHQEVVACTRAGLTRTEAMGLTRRQRHAWLIAFSAQEEESYNEAKRRG